EAKHSSETARYVALELRERIDLGALSEVQASARQLSRAWAGLIRAGLRDMDRLYRALDWGRETAEGWTFGGHGRVIYGYARLLAGAYLLADRIRDVMGIDPTSWLDETAADLERAAIDQTTRSGIRNGRDSARDPVALFTKAARAALAGDPF